MRPRVVGFLGVAACLACAITKGDATNLPVNNEKKTAKKA